MAVMVFFKQENWHLLEKFTVQNLSNNRKLVHAEKFGIILAFGK